MAVGARDRAGQANAGRAVANGFYNRFASWIASYPIRDLTSGFRAVRARQFRQFLPLLPNKFSYPTTVTMSFLKMGYPVAYVPVDVAQRIGKSHIAPVRDGIRFLIIIFKIATLFSPLKMFLPSAALLFLLGLGNYAYTYAVDGRFTNMSALMMTAAVVVGLMGLLSEQVCALTYAALEPPGDERAKLARRGHRGSRRLSGRRVRGARSHGSVPEQRAREADTAAGAFVDLSAPCGGLRTALRA